MSRIIHLIISLTIINLQVIANTCIIEFIAINLSIICTINTDHVHKYGLYINIQKSGFKKWIYSLEQKLCVIFN